MIYNSLSTKNIEKSFKIDFKPLPVGSGKQKLDRLIPVGPTLSFQVTRHVGHNVHAAGQPLL